MPKFLAHIQPFAVEPPDDLPPELLPLDGTAPWSIENTARRALGLLAAGEITLGFLMSDALKRGVHEELTFYGAVHTGIGIAIPALIIGSGLVIDFFPGLRP